MAAPKKNVRLNPNTGKNQKVTEGYKKPNKFKTAIKNSSTVKALSPSHIKKDIKKSTDIWKNRGKRK